MAVYFLTPFMGSALVTSIADIGIELSMGVNAAGSIISAYVLSTAAFLLPVSKISDAFGYLRTLFFGALLFLCTTALCGFAVNGHMLISMRLIEGFAASMIFCSGMTLISLHFPPEERGKAMGMITFMVYSGLSLGPMIGGYLNSRFGWRSIFWFGIALTLFVLVFFVTRRLPFEKIKKVNFDIYGMVFYFLATSLFFAGFSVQSAYGALLALSGVAMYAVFFFHEKKQSDPLLDVNLLKTNRVFVMSSVSSLLNYMAASAVLFLVSMELRISFGYETTHIGLVLLAQSLAMTITAPLAGRYSDRHPDSRIASAGMAVIAVMLFLMSVTSGVDNPYMLAGLQFCIGVGFGMFAPSNNKVIMNSVEKRYYSTASSVLASMRLYGQILSIGLSVMVISLIAGKVKVEHLSPDKLTHSLKAVFLMYCAISIVGVFTSLFRKNKAGE
ncbi:MAG: MFS transporter [Deferribacterales bacterium]